MSPIEITPFATIDRLSSRQSFGLWAWLGYRESSVGPVANEKFRDVRSRNGGGNSGKSTLPSVIVSPFRRDTWISSGTCRGLCPRPDASFATNFSAAPISIAAESRGDDPLGEARRPAESDDNPMLVLTGLAKMDRGTLASRVRRFFFFLSLKLTSRDRIDRGTYDFGDLDWAGFLVCFIIGFFYGFLGIVWQCSMSSIHLGVQGESVVLTLVGCRTAASRLLWSRLGFCWDFNMRTGSFGLSLQLCWHCLHFLRLCNIYLFIYSLLMDGKFFRTLYYINII